jgi:hypothetical protein
MPARRLTRPSLLGAGLLGLAACAAPASPERMALSQETAPQAVVRQPAYHSLAVGRFGGGGDTNPLLLSQVSDGAFQNALAESFKAGGYLIEGGANAYVVSGNIVALDRPTGSLDPTLWFMPVPWSVTIKVHYVVARPGEKPVFDEIVAATGTADAAAALGAQGRVQKAVEAAVRADIHAFLERLNASWTS